MTTWITKDGVKHELKNLTDVHLHNIRSYLDKKGEEDRSIYHEIALEQFIRWHSPTAPHLRELVELLKNLIQAKALEGEWEDFDEEIRNELNGLGQEW